MENSDWRLRGQEAYLAGRRLYFIPFRALSPELDHDHCEFCWAKFMEHPQCLGDGWCTEPENRPGARWVCDGCFQDFREEFQWEL